jgi:hypothetical protein
MKKLVYSQAINVGDKSTIDRLNKKIKNLKATSTTGEVLPNPTPEVTIAKIDSKPETNILDPEKNTTLKTGTSIPEEPESKILFQKPEKLNKIMKRLYQ